MVVRVASLASVVLILIGCNPEMAPPPAKVPHLAGTPDVSGASHDGGSSPVDPSLDGGATWEEEPDAGAPAEDLPDAGAPPEPSPDAGSLEPHVHPDITIPFGFMEPAACVPTRPLLGVRHPHACSETRHLADGSASTITVRDREGRVIRTQIDRSQAPDELEIRQYDAAGRLIFLDTATARSWKTTRWVYTEEGDLLERSVERGDDDGGPYSRTVFTFKASRLVWVEHDEKTEGTQTSSYDPESRNLRLRTERSGELFFESFTYDEAGRTLAHFLNDPWIDDTWTYHPNGAVASERIGRDLGSSLERTFDEQGRVTYQQPGNSHYTYRDGEAGLLEVLGTHGGENSTGSSRRVLQYDAVGRLQLEWRLRDSFALFDDGCWHARSSERRIYSCQGELLRREIVSNLPWEAGSISYERDAAGNLLRETRYDATGVRTEWTEYGYQGCFDAP